MKFGLKGRHIPARLATGAFILNSGLEKSQGDEQTAQMLHGMASGTYPFLGKMQPTQFLKALSTTEIVLGAALLLPVVPTIVAGAGLAAFSGGLLGLYLRTPGLRQEGSIRPSQQGVPIAKDVWMLGIAGGFIVDELFSPKSKPAVETVIVYRDPDDDRWVASEGDEAPRDDFVITSGAAG